MAVLEHEHRVLFGDTDAMGIVYYANYLKYFEVARSEWFRKFYMPPTQMIEDDNYLIVLDAHCNYKRPARYDDLIRIEAWVRQDKVHAATMRFEFELFSSADNALLVSGYTTHTFVDNTGRLKRMPKKFKGALKELSEDRAIEK